VAKEIFKMFKVHNPYVRGVFDILWAVIFFVAILVVGAIIIEKIIGG
jgi:hypothetical protein